MFRPPGPGGKVGMVMLHYRRGDAAHADAALDEVEQKRLQQMLNNGDAPAAADAVMEDVVGDANEEGDEDAGEMGEVAAAAPAPSSPSEPSGGGAPGAANEVAAPPSSPEQAGGGAAMMATEEDEAAEELVEAAARAWNVTKYEFQAAEALVMLSKNINS
jgi:hypothetical protein